MTNLPIIHAVPDLSWERECGSGMWLESFILILIGLLPENYSNSKDAYNAVDSVATASRYFIAPLDRTLSLDEEHWSGQISTAARSGEWSLVISEFKQYVANGRKSTMSYKQACQCLENHKRILFGLGPFGEAGLQQAKWYLKRLRDLRLAINKLISFLDIDKTYKAGCLFNNNIYQINPRKLYEEFKSHYAYETALCIPMY